MIDFHVNKELSQPGSEAIVKTLKISFPIIKKYIPFFPPYLIIKSRGVLQMALMQFFTFVTFGA